MLTVQIIGMMQNKKIIVVCGNIASGKSTVCRRIKEKGFVVIDLDEITHQIYEQGTDLYYKLIDEFGEGILDENSNIDRKKLSNIVFNSKTLLKKLEELTHTDIILRVVKRIKQEKSDLIFLEISMYLESKNLIDKYIDVDEDWVVVADRNIRIQRIMDRNNFDYDTAVTRINSQLDYEKKISEFDEVIVNNTTEADLILTVDELIDRKKL